MRRLVSKKLSMLCDISRTDCAAEQGLYPVSYNSTRCFFGFDTTLFLVGSIYYGAL